MIFCCCFYRNTEKKAQRGEIFLSTILSKSSSVCNNDNNNNNLKSAFAHIIVIQFLCLNVSYQNCNENEISIERGEKKNGKIPHYYIKESYSGSNDIFICYNFFKLHI